MQELTFEEIRSLCLDIMQDVHEFCVNNNIRYSLGCGSLIGAVRHKGYIPWDDDIDILMPRPDYERFCNDYHSAKGYECMCYQKGEYWSAYARVCDAKRTYVHSPSPMGKKDLGVWIDVLPVDGAENDPTEFSKHANEALDRFNRLQRVRSFQKVRNSTFLIRLGFYAISFFKQLNVNKETEKYIECCKRIPYGSTKYAAIYTTPLLGAPRHHSYDAFKDYLLVPFEDKSFYIIKEYDHYLSNIYGDYMKLPPEGKRVPVHSMHKYYWKKEGEVIPRDRYSIHNLKDSVLFTLRNLFHV